MSDTPGMDRIRQWVHETWPGTHTPLPRPSWHPSLDVPTRPPTDPGDLADGQRMVELFGRRGYYWARRNGQLTLRRRRFTHDDVDRSFVDHPAGRHQPGGPKAVVQLDGVRTSLADELHARIRSQVDELVRAAATAREHRMVGGRRAYDLLTGVLHDAGLMVDRQLTDTERNDAQLLWDLVVHGHAFVDANDTRIDPLLVTRDRDGWTAALDGQTAVVEPAREHLVQLVKNAQVRATPPKLPPSTSADVPPAGDQPAAQQQALAAPTTAQVHIDDHTTVAVDVQAALRAPFRVQPPGGWLR